MTLVSKLLFAHLQGSSKTAVTEFVPAAVASLSSLFSLIVTPPPMPRIYLFVLHDCSFSASSFPFPPKAERDSIVLIILTVVSKTNRSFPFMDAVKFLRAWEIAHTTEMILNPRLTPVSRKYSWIYHCLGDRGRLSGQLSWNKISDVESLPRSLPGKLCRTPNFPSHGRVWKT